MSPQQTYLAYLLRLWRSPGESSQGWRASLEDPQSGERRGFGSMAELYDYLREHTQQREATGRSDQTAPPQHDG